jgi:hypothetical protein
MPHKRKWPTLWAGSLSGNRRLRLRVDIAIEPTVPISASDPDGGTAMNPDWNTIIVALGVAFTGAQIVFASWWAGRQLGAQLEWSRREAALSFSMARNPILREARTDLDKIFDGRSYSCPPPSREEIVRLIKEKEGFYTNMTTILSNWNVMAVAIRSGVADEDVAFEMIANSMLDSIDFFRSFLELRQKEAPLAYEHMMKLDARWRERLGKRTEPADFDEPFVVRDRLAGEGHGSRRLRGLSLPPYPAR